MDVVVEMLENKPELTRVLPLSSLAGANLELAIVEVDHIEAIFPLPLTFRTKGTT